MMTIRTCHLTPPVTIVVTRTILRRVVKTTGTAFDDQQSLAADSSGSRRWRRNHLRLAEFLRGASEETRARTSFRVPMQW